MKLFLFYNYHAGAHLSLCGKPNYELLISIYFV